MPWIKFLALILEKYSSCGFKLWLVMFWRCKNRRSLLASIHDLGQYPQPYGRGFPLALFYISSHEPCLGLTTSQKTIHSENTFKPSYWLGQWQPVWNWRWIAPSFQIVIPFELAGISQGNIGRPLDDLETMATISTQSHGNCLLSYFPGVRSHIRAGPDKPDMGCLVRPAPIQRPYGWLWIPETASDHTALVISQLSVLDPLDPSVSNLRLFVNAQIPRLTVALQSSHQLWIVPKQTQIVSNPLKQRKSFYSIKSSLRAKPNSDWARDQLPALQIRPSSVVIAVQGCLPKKPWHSYEIHTSGRGSPLRFTKMIKPKPKAN